MLTWWGIMLDVVDFHRVPIFYRRNFDSVNFFSRTFKFVVVRMESRNNLRFDEPTVPVKVKRKAEGSGNPEGKRRLFLNKRESEARLACLNF